MKSGIFMGEIQRLRPHYQSSSMLDHGRRQLLDHFEEFLRTQGARSPITVHPAVMAAEVIAALQELRRIGDFVTNDLAAPTGTRISEICSEIELKLFGARRDVRNT